MRAVEAGADIILLPLDVDSTIHAIKEAVLSGRISEERIDESVERIWLAKEEMNLFSDKGKRDWQKSNLIIGNPKHLNIASKMAQLSITVVKDKNDLLNKISDYKNIAHLSITEDKNSQRYLLPMKNQLNSSYPDLMEIIITEKVNDKKINEIVDKLKNVDLAFISIVVRIRMNKGIATIDPSYAELLKKLHKKGIQFIVTSFGSPYLPDYKYIDTYIAAFGYGSVLVKAAANALLTNNNITGRLPVDLNNQFIRGSQVLVYREESIIDKLDISYSLSVIDSAIEAKVFPGAQVYISKNGNTIISKGFGYHTYHKSKEVTTKTIFDLASITKVVSATPIIMKLVNDKEIYLDQPINDYFPGFHQSGKDTITIRHLLIHESGLSAYHRYFLESKYRGRGEVLDNIINRRLTYRPGSEYKYSDLGMILLGTILERVGGNNLHALGKSWFYSPLGMNNTFYNPPPNVWKDIPPTERTVVPIGTSKNSLRRKIAGIASELIGPMKSLSYDLYPRKTAHGYVHDENANLLGGISAHAGLFSNAEDLGKYSQMLLNDGMIGDKKIIDKELISLFTSRQSTVNEANRGYGWDRPDRDGTSSAGDYFSDKAFGHLGYTGTSFWIDPEQELVVVLLTNRVYPTRNNPGIKQVRRKFHNTLNKSILRFN